MSPLLEQFDTLDVTVQEEFEKFLQERGINESLASFIPEFAEYKEQKVRVCCRGRPRHEISWHRNQVANAPDRRST